MKVRPSGVAILLKKLFRVRRQAVESLSGNRFWIDPVSNLGWHLLSTGEYERPLQELLDCVLRTGDVFLDIGANEGYFSVLGSKRVGPSGKVFAVEPQGRLIPIIRENLRLNATSNVTVAHTALAEKEGEAVLYLANSLNSGSSSLFRIVKNGDGSEHVKQVALDQFFASNGIARARFIKIDCEGAEYVILSGAKRILREQRIEFVSVDFHPTIASRDEVFGIDRAMREAGYLLTRTGNGTWVYHLPGLEKELSPMGAHAPVDDIAA